MNKQTEALKLAMDALEETLRTLDDENAKPGGAISDTIWYSEHETLFDYIAAQITAIREALAERCVCGEPDTPGTHRTDGPCLAEQPAQPPPFLEPDYYVYNIDGQYRLADPQPTIKWGKK